MNQVDPDCGWCPDPLNELDSMGELALGADCRLDRHDRQPADIRLM